MASNLDPKTAGFDTTGVMLGAEQYPSTVQQGVAGNTGYLMYSPNNLINNMYEWRVTETNGTQYGRCFLGAGMYDLYAGAVVTYAGAPTGGTWAMKFDGTTVAHGSLADNTGTALAVSIAADGWVSTTITTNASGGNTSIIRAWAFAARQYL